MVSVSVKRLITVTSRMLGRRKTSFFVKAFEYIILFAIFTVFHGLLMPLDTTSTPVCNSSPIEHVDESSKVIRLATTVPTVNERKADPECEVLAQKDNRVLKKLRRIKEELEEAYSHQRGGRISKRLQSALFKVKEILAIVRNESEPVENPDFLGETEVLPKNVCPEVYKGPLYDYPLHNNGFEPEECNFTKPLHTLVTVLLNFCGPETSSQTIRRVLKGIEQTYPQMSVYVVMDNRNAIDMAGFTGLNVTRFSENCENSPSDAEMWKMAGDKVTTKYTFVGRDLTHFTNDTRFQRLILAAETLNVSHVGGAWRTPDGHWNMGCHQTLFRNWTLNYRSGYYKSFKECVYCGYLPGPFLAETQALKSLGFDKSLPASVMFEDFFLRMRSDAVVCPDAMFHVEDTSAKYSQRSKFLPLVRKWHINKIKFANEKSYAYSCQEANLLCGHKDKGYAVAPCCLQSLADAVKFFMDTCDKNNLLCELTEGTLLGAVKLNKVLPWERDADLLFHTANYSALAALRSMFRERRYDFNDKGNSSVWCCVDGRKAGGKIQISTKDGWSIETAGQHMMESELLIQQGLAPTRVFYDGQWVTVTRNPGLAARNRYGREIYRHAQHWMTMGKRGGYEDYSTSGFSPCNSPDHHACLDRYSVDGNIQFEYCDL
ncbi:uncharacterized protein [Ptychodera flava]|uniref:uncharacterized protein n=1 Tax=Ptychodera flava TaxID=63121 RepID=UPI00396A33CF